MDNMLGAHLVFVGVLLSSMVSLAKCLRFCALYVAELTGEGMQYGCSYVSK